MMHRLAVWQRNLSAGTRLYRRTPVVLSLLLTRRYRTGLGLMAGMLAVGQLATLGLVV